MDRALRACLFNARTISTDLRKATSGKGSR